MHAVRGHSLHERGEPCIRGRRTIAGNQVKRLAGGELTVHRVQNIEQPRVDRLYLVGAEVAEEVVNFFERARHIVTVFPVRRLPIYRCTGSIGILSWGILIQSSASAAPGMSNEAAVNAPIFSRRRRLIGSASFPSSGRFMPTPPEETWRTRAGINLARDPSPRGTFPALAS